MISLSILDKKKSFTKVNGDTVVDLIRRSVSFLGKKVGQGTAYLVEEGLQMRADLISKHFYQTSTYTCVLLKYNSISNPFSVDVNDFIRIPDESVINSILVTPDDINGSPANWQTSTRKKKKKATIKPATKLDQNRVDYLSKNAKTDVTPTNIAKDTSVKIANGKIVFGNDVISVRKEDCPDPISRTKLQAALLKNKLFS
jgi:hypothetical protein